MFLKIVFFVTFGCVGIVHSTSEPTSGCDVIYDTFLKIRNNILYNPSVSIIWPRIKGKIINMTEVVKVSVDDDEQLRKLACDMAAAETLADLAEITNYPEEELARYFTGNEDLTEFKMDEQRKQFRNMNRWIMRSGFPDEWPLKRITIDRTKQMLNSAHGMSGFIIRFSLNWEMSDGELAGVLNDSSIESLDEYVERLGDPEHIRIEGVEFARLLGSKQGLNDVLDMSYAIEATYLMINDELLHLWRD